MTHGLLFSIMIRKLYRLIAKMLHLLNVQFENRTTIFFINASFRVKKSTSAIVFTNNFPQGSLY